MTTGTPRCACGQPAPDSTICWTCTTSLQQALQSLLDTTTPSGETIPGLATELDIALARQAVLGDHTPARGHSAPLPYDERVADAAGHLRSVLAGWVRVLTEAG